MADSFVKQKINDIFSLNLLKDNFKGFNPVTGPFDSKGQWNHKYNIFTLAAGVGIKVGQLDIQRQNIGGDKFKLNINNRKQILDGFYYDLSAELVCVDNILGRVVSWRFTGATFDKFGNEVEYTKLTKKGSIANGNMTICCQNRCVERKLGSIYAFGCSMFEAVQRLNIGNDRIDFTYIDDFDQVKTEQSLKAYKDVSIELVHKSSVVTIKEKLEKGSIEKPHIIKDQSGTLNITGYEHTGKGILPYVYWLDSNNRCQFVVSGIEAYILKQEKQA